MKSRQVKKNVNQEGSVNEPRSELIGRSLSHLNRSVRQFSEGLQSRLWTLQERLVLDRLEAAAWVMSQRVRRVQNKVFDFIDGKISNIEEKRARKLDYQTALERFDGEGGAMKATTGGDSGPPPPPKEGEKTRPPRPAKAPPFAHEPGLGH